MTSNDQKSSIMIEHQARKQDFIKNIIEHPGAFQAFDFADGKLQVIGVTVLKDGPLAGKKLSEFKKHMPNVRRFAAHWKSTLSHNTTTQKNWLLKSWENAKLDGTSKQSSGRISIKTLHDPTYTTLGVVFRSSPTNKNTKLN